jgi:DNA replication and repair protein RecF
MRLRQISISNFRNFESASIKPGENFNLFYGMNGQGKTNLLEAIYVLGNSRSFRYAKLPDLIRQGQSYSKILGGISSGGITSSISLRLEHSGRKVEMDGKTVQKVSDLHGKLTTVVFSPDDTGMVKFGPDTRRRYLDRAVYTGDIAYLFCWHDYHRILKQRNVLLKQQVKSGLDIWTEKLAETGAEVIFRRQNYIAVLNRLLEKHYNTISGSCEKAGITYSPEGVNGNEASKIHSDLIELYSRHEKIDEKYGTTTAGPHRDDLTFHLDGRPLKSLGSQGQQKSFVLALKMAEIDHLQSMYEEPPILLLDDISSELDMERKRNLLGFLNSRQIQTFITTTEPSTALIEATTKCSVFHVEQGNLTYKGNESNE